jgi:hypothetical protein
MKKVMMFAGAAALGAAAMSRSDQGRRAAQGDPVAARELVLYAVNDGRIYPMRQNVEEGLRKKLAKGRFDAAKAPQAYAAWLETAAKQYNREFGSPGVSWHRVFDAPTRRLAAQEMVDDFLAEEGVQGLPARGRRAAYPDSWLQKDHVDPVETVNNVPIYHDWEAKQYIVAFDPARSATWEYANTKRDAKKIARQGQRSRKNWLGMQGLPAMGRRARYPIGSIVKSKDFLPDRHSDGTHYSHGGPGDLGQIESYAFEKEGPFGNQWDWPNVDWDYGKGMGYSTVKPAKFRVMSTGSGTYVPGKREGQRSRKIWLGMQGLPARGRRASIRDRLFYGNYASAEAYLDGRAFRKLPGTKTVLRREVDGEVSVYHHRTPIVTYHRNGSVTLVPFDSLTTRQRINHYVPSNVSIFRKNWQQFVDTQKGTFAVSDGEPVKISKVGNVTQRGKRLRPSR